MVAIGLVPELTMEAAKRAALGAGAKVVGSFSYELTNMDLEKIASLDPDIILLSGGIDGGQKKTIVHNARVLSGISINPPIILACNRVATEEAAAALTHKGKNVYITANVMPQLDKICVDEVREKIREIFITHIVKAKGLDKVRNYLDEFVLPTPAAVLKAGELLANGCDDEGGLGELLIVDIGGATTDIHSVALGQPSQSGIVFKGLPEPFTKRTVEGDLGIRFNAKYIVDRVGVNLLSKKTGLKREYILSRVSKISSVAQAISTTEEEMILDEALAELSTELAIERHVGMTDSVYTTAGEVTVQYGKDLLTVNTIIGSGGIFCFGTDPKRILQKACFSSEKPWLLAPRKPSLFIDHDYILAHMGLCASINPKIALRIIKKSLSKL